MKQEIGILVTTLVEQEDVIHLMKMLVIVLWIVRENVVEVRDLVRQSSLKLWRRLRHGL